MKELLDDVEAAIVAAPSLADIVVKGGGVTQVESVEDLPDQIKTPAIGLVDGGSSGTHFSSGVRWITFRVIVVVYVRIFDQLKKIKGRTPTAAFPENRAATDLQKAVRSVLDKDRIGGKYARAFFRSDDPTKMVKSDQNEFYLAKPSVFEYIRAET